MRNIIEMPRIIINVLRSAGRNTARDFLQYMLWSQGLKKDFLSNFNTLKIAILTLFPYQIQAKKQVPVDRNCGV